MKVSECLNVVWLLWKEIVCKLMMEKSSRGEDTAEDQCFYTAFRDSLPGKIESLMAIHNDKTNAE